jgi:ABC-2 type transport system ATP-binding protein
MTVREYLSFVSKIKLGEKPKAERDMRIDHVMKRTRVDDMASRHCSKLSKGYRQRVGLAQALLHDPEVLILDEPTAGLDPKQIIETRDLIKSLAGSHTIVLSTHILPEVAQTCQRVVIISRGRVVAEDTPENLTHQLKGAATLYVQVDGAPDAGAAIAAMPGVMKVTEVERHDRISGLEIESEPNRDVRRDVARLIVEKGWGLLELRPTRLSLEEIFLQLTTEERPEDRMAPPAVSPGAASAGDTAETTEAARG